MNQIIQPITPDGLVGFDEHGQLCAWEQDGESKRGWVIADVRETICAICGRKWEATSEDLKNQYRLRDDDGWVHKTCFKGHLALSESAFWYSSICAARIRFHGLTAISNEYRGVWNLPWYRAPLLDRRGSLKLGRRKRVYHMEIELSGEPRYDKEKAKEFLVKVGNVTKAETPGGLYLHAWNDEEVKRNLKAFAEILGLPDPSESTQEHA